MSSSVRDKVAATQKAQNKAEEAKRLGVAVEAAPSPVVEEPARARDEDGHFVADDPSTPEVNEAWCRHRDTHRTFKQVFRSPK